jgi:hypothetical protein
MYYTRLWQVASMSLMFQICCGCGGSSTTSGGQPPAVVNPGLPQQQDNVPDAEPIQGATAGAPLGTNPDYHVTSLVPRVVSSVGKIRNASALGTGLTFLVEKATVTAASVTDPAAVDFDATTGLSFDEGTAINLWIQYETADNATFMWHWNLDTPPVDLREDHTEPTAGVHTAYLTVPLPLDTVSQADITSHFKIDFDVKSSSAVVILDGPSSAQVAFTIKNVPTDDIKYPPIEGGAYLAWEDLISTSDYDYNDLVCGLDATESRRQTDGKVVQIKFRIKAIARGAGYNSDWQFNMDGAFPGATCTAIIQQYSADGTPDGPQRTWRSTDGVSIPVLVSNQTDALPIPADHSFATNVVKDTTWVDGDYADVTILFDQPLTVGSYTPIPYKPQLRVSAGSGTVYIVGLWTKRGDPVDNNGRPLGFVIPGNFAWPMERVLIWDGYPRFTEWVEWVNDLGQPENAQPTWWLDTPVYADANGEPNVYKPEYFLGNPKPMPIQF